LKKVFGRMVSSTCPLATTSSVYVDVSSNEVCYLAVELVFNKFCDKIYYCTCNLLVPSTFMMMYIYCIRLLFYRRNSAYSHLLVVI